MSNLARAAKRSASQVDIADLIRKGRGAAPDPEVDAVRKLLNQTDPRTSEAVPSLDELLEVDVKVDPSGTIISSEPVGPGGVAYRGGNKTSPAGGTRHVEPTYSETGEVRGSTKTPAQLSQERLAQKKSNREATPVTLDNEGNPTKRYKTSSTSKQFPDVIADNPEGALIESIFSGNPEMVDSYRSWYAGLDDKARARVDAVASQSEIGKEALGIVQGNDISPERMAAIRATTQAEGGVVGDLTENAPGQGAYVLPDDLRKKGAETPEGVRSRFDSKDSMHATELPEPTETGRIKGASGVGSLRKQLDRGKVKDGEYVSAPTVSDRQAELDNTSELRSFADQLRYTLDHMGGSKQGTSKQVPVQLDANGNELSRGAGATRRGSRIPDEAKTSGMVQGLWERMQTGGRKDRVLSPTEKFDSPEAFAEHALHLAESNPSVTLSDADAFNALTEAARKEYWSGDRTRPLTDEPAVGNQINPEKPYIAKPEGGFGAPTAKSKPATPETKAKDVEATPLTEKQRASLAAQRAVDNQRMQDALANLGVEDIPEDINFSPADYPDAAIALKRNGWHKPTEGGWRQNKATETLAAPVKQNVNIRYGKDPTDPADKGVEASVEMMAPARGRSRYGMVDPDKAIREHQANRAKALQGDLFGMYGPEAARDPFTRSGKIPEGLTFDAPPVKPFVSSVDPETPLGKRIAEYQRMKETELKSLTNNVNALQRESQIPGGDLNEYFADARAAIAAEKAGLNPEDFLEFANKKKAAGSGAVSKGVNSVKEYASSILSSKEPTLLNPFSWTPKGKLAAGGAVGAYAGAQGLGVVKDAASDWDAASHKSSHEERERAANNGRTYQEMTPEERKRIREERYGLSN